MHFAGGRTETIRSATSDAAAWVAAVERDAPAEEQAALLRASAQRHSVEARGAAAGKGFDRHLFVLKRLAQSSGSRAAMRLFEDPSYVQLSGNELSTSTLTIKSTLQSIFGPVHAEGYGVMYHQPPNELHFCVTTYKPRSASQFAAEIDRALQHVETLLDSTPMPQKK